ncbi:hypothetical protein ACFQE1_00300 [Halobium palmae]|uniref:Uncharacterized protein n=1 Tax=Halobium palmae TaxID=1776492 RepID=A0ABD5RUF2_9EURY
MADESQLKTFEQRKLDTYRQLGLRDNITTLIEQTVDIPRPAIETLSHHTQFILGHRWDRIDGETTDLTESMSGMWESNKDLRQHCDLLKQYGLIECKSLHRNRKYWDISGPVWDIIDKRWQFDIGEGGEHRRAVSLLKTYYHALLRCEIDEYPALSTGGSVDLTVYIPPPERDYSASRKQRAVLRKETIKEMIDIKKRRAARERRREMYPPGTKHTIAIEVMMDHHNTQSVLDRFDQIKATTYDGLWIFQNRECMNKWIRRLDDHGRIDTPYSWSATTPINTAQDRIKELDEPPMRSVTTVARVESWIRDYPGRKLMLRRAEPLQEF